MIMADATNEKGAVVITGASTGIGKAIALHLSGMGYEVFAGVRKVADGEALKGEASGSLTPVIIDVTDNGSIKSAALLVEESAGERGIKGLVNNAGIAVAAPMEFLPLELLEKQLEVNVIGQVAVTQAFMPHIRKGRGRIINMGSDNGKASMPYTGPYCASKHAMEAVNDAFRMELREWGIEVVMIEPGSINTPIWDKSIAAAEELRAGLPQKGIEYYGPAITAMFKVAQEMKRTSVSPEKVARVVARALTARRPKTRYQVGWDGRVQIFLARWMPDRLRDRMLLKLLSLVGKG